MRFDRDNLNQFIMEYRGSKNWLWELTNRNLSLLMGENNSQKVNKGCFIVGIYGLRRYDFMGDWMQRTKQLEGRIEVLERIERQNRNRQLHRFIPRLLIKKIGGDGLSQEQIDARLQSMFTTSKERVCKAMNWGYESVSYLFEKIKQKSPVKIQLTPEAEQYVKKQVQEFQPKGRKAMALIKQCWQKILSRTEVTQETKQKIEKEVNRTYQRVMEAQKSLRSKIVSQLSIEGGLTDQQLTLIKQRRRILSQKSKSSIIVRQSKQ